MKELRAEGEGFEPLVARKSGLQPHPNLRQGRPRSTLTIEPSESADQQMRLWRRRRFGKFPRPSPTIMSRTRTARVSTRLAYSPEELEVIEPH